MQRATVRGGRYEEKRPEAVGVEFGGKRPGVPKISRNKESALSKKFKLVYDTYENVNKQGKELLDNWKVLIEENDKALKAAFRKQKNMAQGKLSENKIRKEIEREINASRNDKHFMQKSIDSVQQYVKDLMHQLRLQRKFLMDNEKVIKGLFSNLESNKRPRIQNPFPKTITEMKTKFKDLFKTSLLITQEERRDVNKRPTTADNTRRYEDMMIFDGKLGRVNVMSPLTEDKLYKCCNPDVLVVNHFNPDKCNDESCLCHRSQSELSFINMELEVLGELYQHEEKGTVPSKCTVGNDGKEVKRHISTIPSKIPIRIVPPLNLSGLRPPANLGISPRKHVKLTLCKNTDVSPRTMSAPQKQSVKVNEIVSGSVSSESAFMSPTGYQRKYRFSKLHKKAIEECYIPRTAQEKVDYKIWQRYCSLKTETGRTAETEISQTSEVINFAYDNTTLIVATSPADIDKPIEKESVKEITDAKSEAGEYNDVSVKNVIERSVVQPKSARLDISEVLDVFPAPDYTAKLTRIEIEHRDLKPYISNMAVVDLKPYNSDLPVVENVNYGKDKKITLKSRITRCLRSLLPNCLKKMKNNRVHPE